MEFNVYGAMHIWNVVQHIDDALSHYRVGQILVVAIAKLLERTLEVTHNTTLWTICIQPRKATISVLADSMRIVYILILLDSTPEIHPRRVVRQCMLEVVAAFRLCFGSEVLLGNVYYRTVSKDAPRHRALHAHNGNERQNES